MKIFQRRYFMVLVICVLAVVLFKTPTLQTFQILLRSNQSMIINPKFYLHTIFIPDAGEEVLPDKVEQMLSLLRAYHIPNYRLSSEFSDDYKIMQRIVESAWPIKNEELSPYVFKPIEEINKLPNCITVGQREEVELVYCH